MIKLFLFCFIPLSAFDYFDSLEILGFWHWFLVMIKIEYPFRFPFPAIFPQGLIMLEIRFKLALVALVDSGHFLLLMSHYFLVLEIRFKLALVALVDFGHFLLLMSHYFLVL
jgi:hypothetical protein